VIKWPKPTQPDPLRSILVTNHGKWLDDKVVIDLEDRVDNKALLGPIHLDKTNDLVIRDVLSHVIN